MCGTWGRIRLRIGTFFDADPDPDLDRNQHENRHQNDAIHNTALYQREK
jgi:hypothetical protein